MNTPHSRCFSSFCVVVAACSAMSLQAQNPPPNAPPVSTTLRVESRIVIVDVVVIDSKGQPVSGLSEKDFQVAEDGRLQIITSLEEHKGDHTTPVKLPQLPSNVFTNFPTAKLSDSVNVVLFDSLNTQSRDQSYVREQLIKYLQDVPPGTRLAIFVLNSQLRMLRGFTTDFSGLSLALDDKREGVQPQVTRYLPTPAQHFSELTVLEAMMRNRASSEAIEAFKAFMADETASLNADRVQITLLAFQQLARYLSGIPARKNVVWFAGSFPISFVPDNKQNVSKHQEQIQHTSDMLTAGQIAIYPVSAEGLVGNPSFDWGRGEPTPNEQFDHVSSTQIAMEKLAEETGGRAFYNTNGLREALADAINIGSRYYTVAYAPTNANFDAKFHRIQVNMPNARRYKLAYRRGYYADRPLSEHSESETTTDPLMPLIGFGMPNFDQILYKVAVAPANPQPARGTARAGSNTELKPPFTRYSIDFAISTEDLKLPAALDGKHHGKLEAMIVAYDRDGKILNILRRDIDLTLDPEMFKTAQTAGLQVHGEIDAPDGDVYLRTGIFDLQSEKCGTLGISLSVLSTVSH
jgi:VWFA-related protein